MLLGRARHSKQDAGEPAQLTNHPRPRTIPQLRSLFWVFVVIMLALLVAYVLEIISWLILGAVVNPSK